MSSRKSSTGLHCTCFPDSSILLHFVFDEKEFAQKVSFLQEQIDENQIPSEILPRINYEITRKMIEASSMFATLLKDISSKMENLAGKAAEQISVDDKLLGLIEKAMAQIMSELRIQDSGIGGDYQAMVTKARLMENAIVYEIHVLLKSKKNSTLRDLIATVQNAFASQYTKYSDRLSDFIRRLNATCLKPQDLLKTSDQLTQKLSTIVRNPWDVKVLCQATGRMFQRNRWAALVSIDYTDLIRNREALEKETLLVVCDPLYLVGHLRERIGSKFTPLEEMKRRGMSYSNILESPLPLGVV